MTDEKKIDPFKPQQPVIPGVPLEATKRRGTTSGWLPKASPFVWLGLAAGVLIIATSIIWWAHGSSASSAPIPVPDEAAAPAPVAPTPVVRPLPIGPGEIATAEEVAKPWSSKKFVFRNPATAEEVPAIAVRLPGGALWGISLREPYGACNLEYVTDLEKLRTAYHFHAEHPMVADPCGRIVFDLSRYGNGPNGLVRGAIVKGTAVRPPIAIEIEAHGNQVFAIRIENTR